MITNPTAINQCFVRLADVNILGVENLPEGRLRVHVECIRVVQGCPLCGVIAHVKDRPQIELVDLHVYAHPTRLIWHKRRFTCPETSCPMGSWTEEDPRIASTGLQMTDRAGRWITEQVRRCVCSVSEVAKELSCDWHTVNDAVLAYGQALLEDPQRFGVVKALGLDEVAFLREAPYYRTQFSTSIVSMSPPPNYLTSCLVVAARSPLRGLRVKVTSGSLTCATPRSISRVPTGPSSPKCCPAPSRWLIPFMW